MADENRSETLSPASEATTLADGKKILPTQPEKRSQETTNMRQEDLPYSVIYSLDWSRGDRTPYMNYERTRGR